MKILRKISVLTLSILAAFLLLLSVLPFVFHQKVSSILLNQIDNAFYGKVISEDPRLSFIRDFPDVSIVFENISFMPPGNNNIDPPGNMNTVCPLKADLLSVSFDLTGLLKKNYIIEKVDLGGASIILDIKSDSLGKLFPSLNNVSYSRGTNPGMSLKNLKITNSSIKLNKSDKIVFEASVNNVSGKIFSEKGETIFSIDAVMDILNPGIPDILFSDEPLRTSINTLITFSRGNVLINETALSINNETLHPAGVIDLNNRNIDLSVSADRLSFSNISRFFGKKLESISSKVNHGIIKPDLNIHGSYGNNNLPAVSGTIKVEDLSVFFGKHLPDLDIESIGAEIKLFLSDPLKSCVINASSTGIAFSGSAFRGDLYLRNLSSPDIDLMLYGSFSCPDIHYLMPEFKDTLRGKIRSAVRLKGKTGPLNQVNRSALAKLNPCLNLGLQDIDYISAASGVSLNNISGNITIARNAWFDRLSFSHDANRFILNGKIEGFGSIIYGGNDPLKIYAGLWSDKLDAESLKSFSKQPPSQKVSGTSHNNIKRELSAFLNFNFDSLAVSRFKSSKVSGSAVLMNSSLNISSLKMRTMEGYVSGNAIITPDSKSKYILNTRLMLDNIDISNTFHAFNNFGQSQLKAENINGKLSGSFNINTILNRNFKTSLENLKVTGNYSIINGSLLNFEPARKLSKFIELSELTDITFSELHNDLIINDNKLIIPSMDIESSAFSIALSGEQYFGGSFEYHLKMLLSEIAGRKAMSSESYISEFGPVEDDGLGKTSVYIKLSGLPGDTRVSYDLDKLSENIKSSLQDEKTKLRTIFREEYGWYKNDSSLLEETGKSRKFRVTWEDSDSIYNSRIPAKQTPGIFRKIKGKNKNSADTLKQKK